MAERQETSEVLSLASRAGRILLENGAEIERVEEVMEHIAEYFGESGEHFFVLSNGIFTSGKGYSNTEYIPIKGTRMDKIAAVNDLSRKITAGEVSFSEASELLDRIDAAPPKPLWELLAGTAVGCAGFCAIFGGGIVECAASMIAGVIMYTFVLLVGSGMSKIMANLCGGIIGTALCILSNRIGFGNNLGNMIIGTLIPLIPGVPFTNGLRDIANEDYLAGTTRLLDAILMFFSIALGVCITFIVHGLFAGGIINLHGTVIDPITAVIPFQLFAAFAGTAAFAVLFGTPREYYLSTGIVGMCGWLVYLLITRFTPLSAVEGTFFSTMCVVLLSYLAARKKKCPSTIFLICGIFPLIPGAGVFWSSYYAVSEQLKPALNAGFTAIKITIAIVLGIVVVTNILHHKRFRKNSKA